MIPSLKNQRPLIILLFPNAITMNHKKRDLLKPQPCTSPIIRKRISEFNTFPGFHFLIFTYIPPAASPQPFLLFFYSDLGQLVLPGAEAKLRSPLDGVDAVSGLDPLQEMGLSGIVTGIDDVQAGLVDGDGI